MPGSEAAPWDIHRDVIQQLRQNADLGEPGLGHPRFLMVPRPETAAQAWLMCDNQGQRVWCWPVGSDQGLPSFFFVYWQHLPTFLWG